MSLCPHQEAHTQDDLHFSALEILLCRKIRSALARKARAVPRRVL